MLADGGICCYCTVCPESLCPALLVFGAIPRPARTWPVPTQLKRARVLDCALDAILKEQEQRKTAYSFKHTEGSKGPKYFAEYDISQLVALF